MTVTKHHFDLVGALLGIIALVECLRGEYLTSLVFLAVAQGGWAQLTWDADASPFPQRGFTIFVIALAILAYIVLAVDAVAVIA